MSSVTITQQKPLTTSFLHLAFGGQPSSLPVECSDGMLHSLSRTTISGCVVSASGVWTKAGRTTRPWHRQAGTADLQDRTVPRHRGTHHRDTLRQPLHHPRHKPEEGGVPQVPQDPQVQGHFVLFFVFCFCFFGLFCHVVQPAWRRGRWTIIGRARMCPLAPCTCCARAMDFLFVTKTGWCALCTKYHANHTVFLG